MKLLLESAKNNRSDWYFKISNCTKKVEERIFLYEQTPGHLANSSPWRTIAQKLKVGKRKKMRTIENLEKGKKNGKNPHARKKKLKNKTMMAVSLYAFTKS